jgi:molybdate transport system ATP-binding protein
MLEVRIKKGLSEFRLDVAFSVNREILTILGPSGSGKTMTLQCIAGLIHPDEGWIKLNGRTLFDSARGINLPPQTRRVGFVFQNYALFHHLSVSQNIEFGIRHRARREAQDRVSYLLDKMNIKKLGDRYPRQLSAGQQQRVAVARALAPEPELLLLDEPFSALDSLVRERLLLELQSVYSIYSGNALFVTHDLAEGYRLGSRIAVYEAGRIVQCDSKEKVVAAPASHTVARLVGFKNLLAGSVVEVKGSNVVVSVPELGGNLRAVVDKAESLLTNDRVTIGIRPENVSLSNAPGENVFASTVDRVVEGVATTSCYCHVDAVATSRHYLMVMLSRPAASRIREGHVCYLSLPPEHVVIVRD